MGTHIMDIMKIGLSNVSVCCVTTIQIGKLIVDIIELSEVYLDNLYTNKNVIAANVAANGLRAKKTPKLVATPLPPRNPRIAG